MLPCFCRVLAATAEQVGVFDMLSGRLTAVDFAGTDMFLLGGSGHYSVTDDDLWMQRALDSLRDVYNSGKPTFASCWGFQAMARAMGGRRVVKDLCHAEPEYIERIAGLPPDRFFELLDETPGTERLLKRFVAQYFSD